MTDVLLISGSFAPREGGAERQMRHLLGRLASEGWQVGVITQSIPGQPDLPREAMVDGVRVLRVGSALAFSKAPRLGQVIFVVEAIAQGLAMRPTTVISLQMGTASLSARAVSALRRVPHIVRLTGGGTKAFRSEPIQRGATTLGRLVGKILDGRMLTLVAPARHLLADHSEAFPSFKGQRLHVINGVSLAKADTAKTLDVAWYARAGSEQSVNTFLAVAMGMPELSFTVFGSLDAQNLPSNVNYVGWTDQPEALIASHRILLNTSIAEGMPNTVLQALAANCRVVGFRNAGMLELLEMYPRNLNLVETESVDGLIKALSESLGQQETPYPDVASIEDVHFKWKQILAGGSI